MAFPIILIDSATGSDSLASGAGPSTALTGTAAATDGDGEIITLDSGTDLTNVLTDGSHVLYLVDATAGERNFSAITAKAGSGGATPTVTVSAAQAFQASQSGLDWAIGGVRDTISSASSLKLIDNNSAAGDAMPGWIIEFQDGHLETGLSATLRMRRAGNTTDGPIVVRGELGATVKPKLTWAADTTCFYLSLDYQQVRDFAIDLSIDGSGAALAIQLGQGTFQICNTTERMTVGNVSFATRYGIYILSEWCTVRSCEVINCSNSGIIHPNITSGVKILGNTIRDGVYLGGAVQLADASGGAVENNSIYNCDNAGIVTTNGNSIFRNPSTIRGNIINGCGDSGMEIGGTDAFLNSIQIIDNILTNNGGYGLEFTGATAIGVNTASMFIFGNTTFNNTSGACNLSGVMQGGTTEDPDYVDAGAGDFTPQNPDLEGTAFPVIIP